MSSRRSRSGGTWISIVLSRNSRSCRKRPFVTSWRTSALVAERMRTSALRVRDEPTRSNSPVSSTRRSFGCRSSGTFAISSRKSVPPSASSKRPTRSALASVKAPFTWPNSSLSKTPSESPPAFTVKSGLPAREETACSAAEHAALAAAVLAGDQHVRVGRPDALDQLEHRPHRLGLGDQQRAARRRAAPGSRPRGAARGAAPAPSSTWVLRIETSRSLSHGFCTKSRAPRRIASTASVHAAPGGHHDHRQRGVERLQLGQEVHALAPGRRVARVVEVDQHARRTRAARPRRGRPAATRRSRARSLPASARGRATRGRPAGRRRRARAA